MISSKIIFDFFIQPKAYFMKFMITTRFMIKNLLKQIIVTIIKLKFNLSVINKKKIFNLNFDFLYFNSEQ